MAFWAFFSAFCLWVSGFIFNFLAFYYEGPAYLFLIPGVVLSYVAGWMLSEGFERLR